MKKNPNKSLTVQENNFLTPSEKDYLKGLIKSFIFAILTLFVLWLIDSFLKWIQFDTKNIYGAIIYNTIKITDVLAVIQLLFFVVYTIINWCIKCIQDRKKWQN